MKKNHRSPSRSGPAGHWPEINTTILSSNVNNPQKHDKFNRVTVTKRQHSHRTLTWQYRKTERLLTGGESIKRIVSNAYHVSLNNTVTKARFSLYLTEKTEVTLQMIPKSRPQTLPLTSVIEHTLSLVWCYFLSLIKSSSGEWPSWCWTLLEVNLTLRLSDSTRLRRANNKQWAGERMKY